MDPSQLSVIKNYALISILSLQYITRNDIFFFLVIYFSFIHHSGHIITTEILDGKNGDAKYYLVGPAWAPHNVDDINVKAKK